MKKFKCGALCAVLAWSAQVAQGNDNPGGWTPVVLDDGVLRFEAHVGAKPARIRLGSASPSNAISQKFASSLSIGGEEDDSLALEQQPPLPSVPLFIASRRVELPQVYRVADERTDVHAGRDFFSQAIVQIDYPNKRLRVLDEDALKLRDLANVPARRVDAEIGTHVRLRIGEVSIWAALATEYSGALLLPRSLAERHGWLDGANSSAADVTDDLGDEFRTDAITLKTVHVGPYGINDVSTVLMAPGESPLAGSYEQETAIVGNDILRFFQVSVDLDRAYVHVQRPE
ncbi:MAG: hypothetical protein AB8G16_06065 [Gammaproteobacteria bacterium]